MNSRFHRLMAGLIFCAIGSVCAGPAIGQNQNNEPSPANGGDAEDEVVELFESDDNPDASQQKVEVGSFGQIDLQVKDLDVTDVLRLLSMQSKKNIIASRNVSGKVSANLFGVDFYQALDAILQPNGFGYREDGDFIYVYTKQELEEIEKANRKQVTRPVRLNYLNTTDAQSIIAPLLSPDGEVAITAETTAGFQPSLSDGGADTYAGDPTLVITDYEENVEEAVALINELDTRPQQVLVEATILQARLTEDNAFGVDFSVFADVDIDTFATPLGAVNEVISGDATPNSGSLVQSNVGNTAAGQSGVKLGFLGSDFSVFVRALDSVTDTTVLSVPKILTLNRQKAQLLVGDKLGYLNTTVTETSRTATVEFLETGTSLAVRPFVSDDGFIRLELRPQVSTGNTDRVVEGNVIPTESTQELTTNVIVRSGQTLVLGGLFTEDTSISRNQVPGLGDIPLAGAAFQGQDDGVDRSEIIFLIKPTVVKDNSLYAAGERMTSEIADLRAGMRQGLLPWSRTKLTQSHMKRALELLEQGEEERALWAVNLVLAINPTATDALELRSRLTGEQVFLRDASVWTRAVSDSIREQMDDVAPMDEAPEEPTPEGGQDPEDMMDEVIGTVEPQPAQEIASATEPEATSRDRSQPAEAADEAEGEQRAEAQAEAEVIDELFGESSVPAGKPRAQAGPEPAALEADETAEAEIEFVTEERTGEAGASFETVEAVDGETYEFTTDEAAFDAAIEQAAAEMVDGEQTAVEAVNVFELIESALPGESADGERAALSEVETK